MCCVFMFVLCFVCLCCVVFCMFVLCFINRTLPYFQDKYITTLANKIRDSSHSPITVGSKSTITALGICFPAPFSQKKVLNESSPPPMVLSLGIAPSGWIQCSKQYSSQQAFPIWTPAWPTWTEIHSRCRKKNKMQFLKLCILGRTYLSNLSLTIVYVRNSW